MNLAIHGDRHLRGHDVIFGSGIMVHIQPVKVLAGLADHVWMNGTELSVWTGITKVERELPRLDLDRQRIGRGRSEVHIRPRLYTKDAEREDFRADQQDGGPDHGLRPAGKILDLRVGPGV